MIKYDKRIFMRLEQTQQEKYLKDNIKHIPDAKDKYEVVDIYHEPIKLLHKKTRHISTLQQLPHNADGTCNQ